MAGPTDVLTEDVKDLRAANRELADEIKRVFDRLSADMRDSNQRLTDAINRLAGDFVNFRVEVAKELGAVNTNIQTLKGEVAKELGVINTNLETFKGRTNTYLAGARWAVGVITAVILGLVAWSYSAYARAVRIEESIMALRDHAKEQDGRIGKLIELREDPGKRKASAIPPTLNTVPPKKSSTIPGSVEPQPQAANPASRSDALAGLIPEMSAEFEDIDPTDSNGGEVSTIQTSYINMPYTILRSLFR